VLYKPFGCVRSFGNEFEAERRAVKGSIESVVEIASDALSLSGLMVRSKLSLAAKICFYGSSWLSMKSEEFGRGG
jgi:hypothetical protein